MNELSRVVGIIMLAALAFVLMTFNAKSQHNHPPEDAALHDKFYSTWMRPDMPATSCCNKEDCYPTVARFENGQWFAKRREDGKWLPVPESKIERKKSMPDTRAHLCAPPPGRPYYPEDHVFCFGYEAGI